MPCLKNIIEIISEKNDDAIKFIMNTDTMKIMVSGPSSIFDLLCAFGKKTLEATFSKDLKAQDFGHQAALQPSLEPTVR